MRPAELPGCPADTEQRHLERERRARYEADRRCRPRQPGAVVEGEGGDPGARDEDHEQLPGDKS